MERKIELESLKKIQIEILDNVASFCDENNINYWLDSGTLLGSVRHKGYIPWDDDIDVGMLRDDYNRFINTFNDSNSRYKAYCIENNKNFYYPYCKVLDFDTILYEPDKNGEKLSVNIDIFVYDKVPNDNLIMNRLYNKRDFYRKCICYKSEKLSDKNNLLHKIALLVVKFFLLPFSKRFFVMKIVKNAKLYYANPNVSCVAPYVAYSRLYCEKDALDKFIEGEFEGKKYKIPAKYDQWLKAFYGDYMKLPPKNERVSHHVFEAYYK